MGIRIAMLTKLFPEREKILKEINIFYTPSVTISLLGVVLDIQVQKYVEQGFLELSVLTKKSPLDKNICSVTITAIGYSHLSTLVGKLIRVSSKDESFWLRHLAKFLPYIRTEYLIPFLVSKNNEIRRLAKKRLNELTLGGKADGTN